MSDPTLRLPFDQYQRYRLVADILEDLRADGERLAVLDVGGRTELLRKFLPDDDVFLVDVEASEAGGLVLGDGSRLPYVDGAVDAVVCFDTLEHVPPPRREAFLDEVLRVARRWAVVAGPYDTEGVAAAELLLEDFLRGKMETEHRYLAEHKEHGLPSFEDSIARLRAGGAEVVPVAHANLQRWLALMCAELYMDRDPQLRALAAKYYEFYNATLYASDHSAPVYRHALVAAKGGAALPDTERLLGPPSAPAGVFEPVRALLEQLCEYDVEREVVQAEWRRLEGVNADLHLDLEGHRESLAALREENEVQRTVIADLRERAIEILGNEDLLEAELEKQREESERQATELKGDLQAHQKALGELDAQLERERQESEAVATTLRVDLEAHQEFVKRLNDRAATLEARVQELDGQVELHETRGTELEQAVAERDAQLEDAAAHAAELQGVLAERDASLRAHAAQAEELQRIREEQAAHAEELRGVLDEQREGIEQLTTEVRTRDERIGDLSTRLDASEAERERSRAAHEAERDELLGRLDAANVALGEKQASLDTVRGELTNQRQVIEDLKRQLGERWGSLLRAFGLK